MSVEKASLGTVVTVDGKKETVKAPCDQKNNGSWYCITHDYNAFNNFEKDSHIGRGKHILAWLCNEHGLEVP